jgi:hypothetical protein
MYPKKALRGSRVTRNGSLIILWTRFYSGIKNIGMLFAIYSAYES